CHLNSLSYITPVMVGINEGIPVIVHSRNAKPPNNIKSQLLHKINFFRLPKRKISRIAVSDLAGEWMFGKRFDFITINNGIDINKFKFNAQLREQMRSEFNIENDELCVLHVGAFRNQKNHMFLLDIFYSILKREEKAKLVLVGSGELLTDVKEKASTLGVLEQIIFAGNRSDIQRMLSGSDVFLFPSFYEGFPNAVLEAQCSGLPCVISDTITTEVL